jgi:hypothetical protein
MHKEPGEDMHEGINGGWTRQPYFSNEMLAPLHELNHRFLDLMGSGGGDWRLPDAAALPGAMTGGVAPLSAAQRAAAAHCPYALFDLNFQEGEHWRARLAAGAAGCVADAAPVDSETAAFIRLALFYAWHVAATAKLAAQLLLGMSEATATAFRGVTLNQLLILVASESVHLTARWPTSSVYWNALTHAAARRDAARLRRIQLFGLQLAAAARLP